MNDQQPQPETAQAAIESLGLTMSATFVPYSRTKDAKSSPNLDDLSLNWTVTIFRTQNGVLIKIITTPYRAGIAHAPAYNDPKCRIDMGRGGFSQWGFDRVRAECETGKTNPGADVLHSVPHETIKPNFANVLHCLVSDASAIDYPTFEQWAADMGCDPDSRKAEATYRDGLETGLKLGLALGGDGLRRIRDAFRDY